MTDFGSDIELYDSDILALEPAIKAIQAKSFTMQDYDQFREEVTNRLGEVGFTCSVVWDETYALGATECRDPIISITGRIDKRHEFDPDRQVHEVTHDLLDLGEGGIITEGGLIKDPPKPVGFSDAN